MKQPVRAHPALAPKLDQEPEPPAVETLAEEPFVEEPPVEEPGEFDMSAFQVQPPETPLAEMDFSFAAPEPPSEMEPKPEETVIEPEAEIELPELSPTETEEESDSEVSGDTVGFEPEDRVENEPEPEPEIEPEFEAGYPEPESEPNTEIEAELPEPEQEPEPEPEVEIPAVEDTPAWDTLNEDAENMEETEALEMPEEESQEADSFSDLGFADLSVDPGDLQTEEPTEEFEPETEELQGVEETSEEFHPPFSEAPLPLPSEGLTPLPGEGPFQIDELRRAEDAQKEKTMNLKGKLFSRKQAAESSDGAEATPSKRRGGGFLSTLLMLLLLVVAGIIWWELHQLTSALGVGGLPFLNGGGAGKADTAGVSEEKSYDYAIDFLLDQNIVAGMQRRGQDGWQVVGSRRTQDGKTGQYGYEFIFMRPRPAGSPLSGPAQKN